jgi:hypothetical protein
MASDAPAEAIGLAPGATSRAERASANAGSTVPPATPWEAVYAARISAPGATRADAVSRVQPLVEAAPQGPATIDAVDAQTTTAATPEARFMAEMQQRASRLEGAGQGAATPVIAAVTTPPPSQVESVSEAPVAPAPTITQEQSNSSEADAARVF